MAKAQRTGVIRDYDMHSASVRVGYGFIIFFCLIMTVIAVFPIIWVVLAGFKDLKEFMSSAKLLPEVFDFSLFAKTWSQLGIAQNYLNSLISVAGSVVCAIVFNGLLGYGLAILKPKGYGIVKKLVMLSLLLPTTISIVPLFMNIQKLNLGGSFVPLWLSYGANAMYVILFVQFFESLYACRTSRCRKLHNICNSVVILDEAQMLPVGFLHPILDVLQSLQASFKASILFTTATLPVFSGRIGTGPEAFDLFLLAIRLQGGQSMLLADLIADQPHPLQGPRREVELFPGVRLHGVHHQVGVEVRPVDMCGHQHFAAGEELFRQLLGDLVGLRRCDVLLGREGLDVVVEPHGTFLVVHIPCGMELPVGQLGRAVLPADQLAAVFIQCFLILRHILRYATEGTGRLFLVFDEGDRGHQRFSCSARSRS